MTSDELVDWLCANEFRAAGKQVLLNDRHIADAHDEEIAGFIADALNYSRGHYDPLIEYAQRRLA